MGHGGRLASNVTMSSGRSWLEHATRASPTTPECQCVCEWLTSTTQRFGNTATNSTPTDRWQTAPVDERIPHGAGDELRHVQDDFRLAVCCIAFGVSAIACGFVEGASARQVAARDVTTLRSETISVIPWSGTPATFAFGVGKIWLLSLSASGKNLWTVDPRSLRVRSAGADLSFDEIVAGGGQLWGYAMTGSLNGVGARLDYLDPGRGYARDEKHLPPECSSIGGRSEIYRRELCLDCDQSVAVFSRSADRPVRIINAPHLSALLPSTRGLWLVDGRVLKCSSGTCRGERIRLPFNFVPVESSSYPDTWVSRGEVAWAIGLQGARHAVIRVDLVRHRITSFVVNGPSSLADPLTIQGRSLLVGDVVKSRILVYDQEHPTKLLQVLKIPRLANGSEAATMHMATHGGFVWASYGTPATVLLIRIRLF
jgi:hypothetical protein